MRMIQSSSSKEGKREEEVEEYTTSNCFYHFIDFVIVGDIFFTSFHECKYFPMRQRNGDCFFYLTSD